MTTTTRATIYRHRQTGALVRVEKHPTHVLLTHADGREERLTPRFWADHKSSSYRWVDPRTQ